MDGQVIRDGDGCDHSVVGSCRWFAADLPQIRRYPTEAASCCGIEWERIEVGLGLLQASLADHSFLICRSNQRTNGEFGKGHSCDQRLIRQTSDFRESSQQDECAGIEDSTGQEITRWGRALGQCPRGTGQDRGEVASPNER